MAPSITNLMASFLETNEHKTTVLAALINQNQPIGEEKGKVNDRVVSCVPQSILL